MVIRDSQEVCVISVCEVNNASAGSCRDALEQWRGEEVEQDSRYSTSLRNAVVHREGILGRVSQHLEYSATPSENRSQHFPSQAVDGAERFCGDDGLPTSPGADVMEGGDQ